MLLSHNRLANLVQRGVITNVTDDMINATSIDLTIGKIIKREIVTKGKQILSLHKRTALNMHDVDISKGFFLEPGEFVLAHSEQTFNLPNNISGEYKLKSSMARIGLEHLNAGWCDAGWNNSVLTLELKNMTQCHSIYIKSGDRIGQIVFFEHEIVPDKASYANRGRYNGDKSVSGIKL